jgi:hypothetical protein
MNGVALSKFEKARDRTHTFGAVFIDLSGFKEINETTLTVRRMGPAVADPKTHGQCEQFARGNLGLEALPEPRGGGRAARAHAPRERLAPLQA